MIPEQEASVPKWQRAVANALNMILRGYPYTSSSSAPANPKASQTYYDTTLNKVRTWDGSAWQNHF